MSLDDYRAKLTVEIRPDQKTRLSQLMPWGTQKAFFEILIDDLISALDQHGMIIIAAVLDHKMRPGEALSLLRPFTSAPKEDGV